MVKRYDLKMVSKISAVNLHNALRELVRCTSASRMKSLSKRPDVEIQEITENRDIFAHWMTLIFIAGPSLRITFKTQFSNVMAQCFAEGAYDLKKEQIENHKSQDFIREYCNLVGGYVKNSLIQQKLEVGISLPLVTRGYDNLFFGELSGFDVYNDRWKLVIGGDVCIYCSVSIEIMDDFKLSNQNLEFEDSGEVKFF